MLFLKYIGLFIVVFLSAMIQKHVLNTGDTAMLIGVIVGAGVYIISITSN